MELVGVSEAARLIGVNKSTLSRQVKKGIIPNRGTEKRPLVNVAEVIEARRNNVDTSKSATPGLGLRAETVVAVESADIASAAAPAETQSRLDFNTARTASAAVDAKLKQLEYAKQTGLVVEKLTVEREAFSTARSLRDRLLAMPARIAGELAVMTDEREIIARLRAALRDVLADASEELKQNIQPSEPAPVEQEGSGS